MANKITNTEHYAAIANAIRRKNGETDTYTPAEMADAIGRIPKGGGGASEGDVTFYDYDGTVVETFSADEFAELTEMPENPDHTAEGLTSQGWNWSLADAKAYVANYGKLNIGQIYVPNDGKTHVFIDIPENDPTYKLTLYYGYGSAGGQTVIDWGDGSPTQTFNQSDSTPTEHHHIYTSPGKYEVTIDVTVGNMTLTSSSNYSGRQYIHFSGAGSYARNLTRVKKIYLGNNCYISGKPFEYSYSLEVFTIPKTITSIGNYTFYYCIALRSITIPDSIGALGTYCFAGSGVKSIAIPKSIRTLGNYALSNCMSLTSITFPDNIQSRGTYLAAYCSSLTCVTIPNNFNTIPEAFARGCTAITNISIPATTTSLGTYSLSGLHGIREIFIPESVTSIASYAFSENYTIVAYHFMGSTPPTLTNANALSGIGEDTIIYVPAASLEAYKTANRWSTYADRMVAEPE